MVILPPRQSPSQVSAAACAEELIAFEIAHPLVEWAGDALDEQKDAEAKEVLLEYLDRHFGPRCHDADDYCPQCQAWAAFDVLFAEAGQ